MQDPTLPAGQTARQRSFRMSSAQLGMLLLLASLSVLFGASLVAYGITRAQNAAWRGDLPPLPDALWLSTLLMLSVSAALEVALRRTKLNHLNAARAALGWSWLLAAAFLACQVLNWLTLASAFDEHTTLYPFTYFFLTGLHAAHVLAGFAPLAVVHLKLRQGDYSSSRYEGLKLCAQYWHFLGVVWAILFVALLIGS